MTLAVTLTGAKYEVIVKVSTQQIRTWADGNTVAGGWMDDVLGGDTHEFVWCDRATVKRRHDLDGSDGRRFGWFGRFRRGVELKGATQRSQ